MVFRSTKMKVLLLLANLVPHYRKRLRVAVERAGEHARSSQKYYKACARDANAPYLRTCTR